jgi:hypothetical protein
MALRGFASHQVRPGTGFESFDSAFALLQAHPERLPNGEFAWGLGPVARCTWTDVRSVAPAELGDQVLEWGCPSGNALRERFWWRLAAARGSRTGCGTLLISMRRMGSPFARAFPTLADARRIDVRGSESPGIEAPSLM